MHFPLQTVSPLFICYVFPLLSHVQVDRCKCQTPSLRF